MKRLIMISCLALGTALGASAASANAAPSTTALGGLTTSHSGVQLVSDRRDRNWRHDRRSRRDWRHHRRYRDHDRYRGWHRYHSRPYGWRARGCVVVGPVWVCP